MDRPPSPVVQRKQLANGLRRLRLAAGLTLEEAAVAIEASSATLSRIETGVRIPRARDVRDLCALYQVADAERIAELTALAGAARESGWWESYTEVDDDYATYIGLEASAGSMQQFEGQYIPAILQTTAYARAYFTGVASPSRAKPFTEHDISKRIEVRERRQDLLNPSSGLAYSVVLDESILLRVMGSPKIMSDQLKALLDRADQPNINLRIVLLSAGAHPGQQGGFTILDLPRDVSDVVYVDTLAGQLFLETPEELERHRRIFHSLDQIALGQAESKEALVRIMAGLGTARA